MLVTVTKPLEDAREHVQGLDHCGRITSRGTAEIDLFFNWNVDMYRTLELVNAALSRAQAHVARHRQAEGESHDVRGVPDHGLQPDVGQDSADRAMGDGDL